MGCNIFLFCFSQSARLMEDFLELAKDNTEKDLETCGVLGAFLVRFMASLTLTLFYAVVFIASRLLCMLA